MFMIDKDGFTRDGLVAGHSLWVPVVLILGYLMGYCSAKKRFTQGSR
ncbi:MAG TPA: hypothetical protein VNU93_03870 [Verrucomicrobiae bacterium]|nr:hypothetical protein [Verrucomicrobiae bacterium]